MELKDFVAETLKQIVEGITIAQTDVGGKGATVNPIGIIALDGGLSIVTESKRYTVQMVDFDISLVEIESGQTRAGIGVFFGNVGAGTQAKVEAGSSATNRVKFSIPMMFPTHKSSP